MEVENMSKNQRQIQINVEELRKNKFFIATPCYGGQLNEPYFRSVIKMMTFFNQHQVPLAFGTIANESLVTRARNVLVAYFLNSDYTHLLFIDADIEFQVEDVLKLYYHDRDVVVGAYPKKGVAWQRIKETMQDSNFKDKQLSDKEIAAFGSDYAINFKFVDKEAKSVAVDRGVIKLHDAGTGFMMIKRDAILKMIKAYPELRYNNDVALGNTDLGDNFYALFDTMIDPIDRRYLSEDYTFCRRWQELGGDIWLDPSISLNHYGHFCFQGNPQAIIQFGPPIETTQPVRQDIKTIDLPDELERA
jgi:hypothetical protein